MIQIKDSQAYDTLIKEKSSDRDIYFQFLQSNYFRDLVKDLGFIFDECSMAIILLARSGWVNEATNINKVLVGKTSSLTLYGVNPEEVKSKKSLTFQEVENDLSCDYVAEKEVWLNSTVNKSLLVLFCLRSIVQRYFIETYKKSRTEALEIGKKFESFVVEYGTGDSL